MDRKLWGRFGRQERNLAQTGVLLSVLMVASQLDPAWDLARRRCLRARIRSALRKTGAVALDCASKPGIYMIDYRMLLEVRAAYFKGGISAFCPESMHRIGYCGLESHHQQSGQTAYHNLLQVLSHVCVWSSICIMQR